VLYSWGVNLKEWAVQQGVGYSTARRWFEDGLLPVPARKIGGLILVNEPEKTSQGLRCQAAMSD
jgi:predicted site-specific integrase-resolvase